jgi:hypothetical protein
MTALPILTSRRTNIRPALAIEADDSPPLVNAVVLSNRVAVLCYLHGLFLSGSGIPLKHGNLR